MKMIKRMPVIDVTQFKNGMETGWSTRSSIDAVLSIYSSESNYNASWHNFSKKDYPNAKEIACSLYKKKDAVPYWEFEGFVIYKPEHKKYYWIEEKKLKIASKKKIMEDYDVIAHQ